MANLVFALAAAWFIRREKMPHLQADIASLCALVAAGFFVPKSMALYEQLGIVLAAAGVVSVMHMFVGNVVTTPSSPLRKAYSETLFIMLALLGFLMAAGIGLPRVVSVMGAATYDQELANLDVKIFGALPAVFLADWLANNPIINQVVLLSYHGIALLIGISFLSPRFRVPFVASALIGYLVYILVPACGPRYAMPSWPEIGEFLIEPPLKHPRNCMPSLHLTWALLMVLNLANVKSRTWRILIAINLPLTVIGTLGLGEHYASDLLLAIPFALIIWKVCRGWR